MRSLLLLLAACVLATGCTTRSLRPHGDDLWGGASTPGSAAFLGFHGPVESERPLLSEN